VVAYEDLGQKPSENWNGRSSSDVVNDIRGNDLYVKERRNTRRNAEIASRPVTPFVRQRQKSEQAVHGKDTSRILESMASSASFSFYSFNGHPGLLGAAIAAYEGFFRWDYYVLAMIGLILVHMTVNVATRLLRLCGRNRLEHPKNSFQRRQWYSSLTSSQPKQAFWFATICLLVAMAIGFYFVMVRGWLLFPLLLLAGFSAYFYNVYLAKWLVGELFAGLTSALSSFSVHITFRRKI